MKKNMFLFAGIILLATLIGCDSGVGGKPNQDGSIPNQNTEKWDAVFEIKSPIMTSKEDIVLDDVFIEKNKDKIYFNEIFAIKDGVYTQLRIETYKEGVLVDASVMTDRKQDIRKLKNDEFSNYNITQESGKCYFYHDNGGDVSIYSYDNPASSQDKYLLTLEYDLLIGNFNIVSGNFILKKISGNTDFFEYVK